MSLSVFGCIKVFQVFSGWLGCVFYFSLNGVSKKVIALKSCFNRIKASNAKKQIQTRKKKFKIRIGNLKLHSTKPFLSVMIVSLRMH